MPPKDINLRLPPTCRAPIEDLTALLAEAGIYQTGYSQQVATLLHAYHGLTVDGSEYRPLAIAVFGAENVENFRTFSVE